MDIKKIELFVDIAETLNFTKTGERMGYTQSGVSHILKTLESEIGFSLFVRTKKGVQLTADGQYLLPYVRKLLKSNEELEQIISSINGIQTGVITIGTFSSVSIHWLPKIIYQFQQKFPHVNLHMKEGGIQNIQSWIEDGSVDFGFFSKQPSHTFDWFPIKEDPLLAVLPYDYPLSDTSEFLLSNFQNQPFIMSETGTDYDIHRTLQDARVSPDIRFSAKDDYAIISMVEHNLGISILPELILKGRTQKVKTLPLNPYAFRTLGIGMLSFEHATPATQMFISYAKKILENEKNIS